MSWSCSSKPVSQFLYALLELLSRKHAAVATLGPGVCYSPGWDSISINEMIRGNFLALDLLLILVTLAMIIGHTDLDYVTK